ncbi:DUF5688 family protein [Anaerostipes sp.]|uniref:DUF5688 family protein n=1 Tax=Anaerostipes sp. TaxID=1872530 RepID=UPI00258B686F|nr:DUF5688 family protein [Anaerostipes sp.]MCI5624196.1 DUF5688 family protein [Anaerostipes sp.]MDY2725533.1 DUF5688 family protein [Anaerostipes faecalis]
MLSKKEFYSYVEHHILEFMKDTREKEAVVQKTAKNNQVSRIGLSVGKREERLLPVLYLEPFYRKYSKGEELDTVLAEIASAYEEYEGCFPLDPGKIEDYDFIKENLFFRLVNYERNQKQLQECPYERMEDLAVTYRWIAYRSHDGMASAIVRYRDIILWGITEEQLKADAIANTKKIFPPTIRKIQSVIPVHVEEGDIPVFVLSNGDYMNGASAMIYKGILKEFAERMNCNLYILPSSIHEVIILLEEDAKDIGELFKMVRETNQSVVDREEVLSDNVYYYDRNADKITIAR